MWLGMTLIFVAGVIFGIIAAGLIHTIIQWFKEYKDEKY